MLGNNLHPMLNRLILLLLYPREVAGWAIVFDFTKNVDH
jgi:hypothetical protein